MEMGRRALSEDLVYELSKSKGEPEWMLQKRLQSLRVFNSKAVPTWGPDLSGLNLDDLSYYVRPGVAQADSLEELPADLRKTFDALGIPEAERKFLAGSGAMYQSEVIYERMKRSLEAQGVAEEVSYMCLRA